MSTNHQRSDDADHEVTSQERQLIADFRLAKGTAQQMLLALAAQYSCTLPADSVGHELGGALDRSSIDIDQKNHE